METVHIHLLYLPRVFAVVPGFMALLFATLSVAAYRFWRFLSLGRLAIAVRVFLLIG